MRFACAPRTKDQSVGLATGWPAVVSFVLALGLAACSGSVTPDGPSSSLVEAASVAAANTKIEAEKVGKLLSLEHTDGTFVPAKNTYLAQLVLRIEFLECGLVGSGASSLFRNRGKWLRAADGCVDGDVTYETGEAPKYGKGYVIAGKATATFAKEDSGWTFVALGTLTNPAPDSDAR